MRIDILVGDNPYGSTALFSRELKRALTKADYTCRLLDFRQGRESEGFYKILSNPPRATCSFSDITAQGRALSECWDIPHITILLDPAFYFLHQVKAKNSLVTCVDLEDVEWLQALGYKNCSFLPHAICESHFVREYPQEGREYEAVFFGTCIDFEEIAERWWRSYPPSLCESLFEASEKILTPQGLPLLRALLEALAYRNCDIDALNLRQLHHELDLYIRGKDRFELLKTLASCLRIEVWGEKVGNRGWKELLGSLKSVNINPSIPFSKTLPLLKKSRFLINSSPRFRKAGHERLLYALAYGAVPITTLNPFLESSFLQDSLIYYQPGEWESLLEKIPLFTPDPTKGHKAGSLFTWNNSLSIFNSLSN